MSAVSACSAPGSTSAPTPAQRQGDLADFLDAVLANGVDIVQLRQKGMEARDELRCLETFAAAAQRHGALWAVNDRADIARASRAPVLHLGQDDLPVPVAREIAGDDVLIGRSTHSPAQFDARPGRAGRGLRLRRPDLADADQARAPGRRP